jgi:amino acid adenylation domain-containing protein
MLGKDTSPAHLTIPALVERWISGQPDAVAVAEGAGSLSYGALGARADRIAALLRSHGVGPETYVGVASPRSTDFVVAVLGVLKAGAAYVPVDLEYPTERQGFMLADARVTAVVTTEEVVRRDGLHLGERRVPVVTVEQAADATAAGLPAAGGRHAAYVIYTSGSTGVPKGVVVEHDDVVSLVTREPRLAVRPGDVVAQLAPTSFDASTFEIWAALCRGATVRLLPGPLLSVKELSAQLRLWRPDWLFLTTGLFHLLADFAPDSLGCVGTLLTGGDVLSPKHIRTAAGLGTTRVHAAYGPTETTVFASLHDAGDVDRDIVPLGRALAGKTMYVLDGDLGRVPDGELGEIYIGGDGVARGYRLRPGLTAARFVPDPYGAEPGARLYRTGDLGRVLPDGAVAFHGRIDRQVKIRGFRIELGEIEAVLAANPAVSGAVVAAFDAQGRDKRLAAYVTGGVGAPPAVSELRAWAAQRLPAHALPSTYVVVGELPLDANGKFDRAALPQPWTSRATITDLPDYLPPRTQTEQTIAAAWTDALGLDAVGLDDNFFALGGDSLLSVSVLEQLRVNGIDLSASEFFSNPTVSQLAGHLAGARDVPAGAGNPG